MFDVPQLDKALGERGSLLLRNEPGTDPVPFLYHAIRHAVAAGQEVVYVVTERPPSRALAALQEYGLPDDVASVIHFADGHSPRTGFPEDAAYPLAAVEDLAKVAKVLDQARAAHPESLIVVDTLSRLLDLAESDETSAGALIEAILAYPAAIAVHTDWAHDALPKALDRFEGVLRLRGVVERVMLKQFFTVEKGQEPGRPVLYRAGRPGGVVVYIPKILVTGPFDAGKTLFVHTVSDSALSAERKGTTVAMDRGHVRMAGIEAEVFGSPGQERFDPLLEPLAGQALGVVLVVDATAPETFQRAKAMLDRVWRHGLHVIVAANKQDRDGALPPEDVAARLGLGQRAPVVGCVASDRDAVRDVLSRLIQRILAGGDA